MMIEDQPMRGHLLRGRSLRLAGLPEKLCVRGSFVLTFGQPPWAVPGLAGQFLAEHCGIGGEGQAGFEVDHLIFHQAGDIAVEVLHTFGGAGLDGLE
jgi:hypothetical protein